MQEGSYSYAYYDPTVDPSFLQYSYELEEQQPHHHQHEQPAAAFPPSQTVQLQQATYSHHHTSLDNAVESARWSYAGYDFDPRANGSSSFGKSYNNSGTVGEMLNSMPSGTLLNSPTSVGPPRHLNFDHPEAADGSAQVKPFITKLVHLVDHPNEYRDCIVWAEDGTSFIVCHAAPRLLQEVLPAHFGHSNIHSFTRQLNVYGFSRMSQVDLSDKLATNSTADYSGWSHPHFLRDDRSSILSLVPKPSRARMQKKVEKQERQQREEETRRTNYREMVEGSGMSGSSSRSASGSLSGVSGGDWAYNAP